MSASEPCFLLSIVGQLEAAEFVDLDSLYCRYSFHHGPDWQLITGLDEGISQIAKTSADAGQQLVWNLPLEACFKSSNPFGWPQLIVSCYGPDVFGHDVIRGYGVCHLPLVSGSHRIRIPMFVPSSISQLQRISSWFSGRRPELIDLSILATGEGREVTRVESQGHVTCSFQLLLKDMEKLGYRAGPSLQVSNSSRSQNAGDATFAG